MILPDRARLRQSVNRIIAHLLEIRLFWDEPTLVLRAQWSLIVENGRLLKQLMLPALILSLPFAAFYFWPTPKWRGETVIVLGVDGMDPAFVERHWDSLPNLKALRDDGYFGRLQTTNPPQSPVAWSTFITGLDPDRHGIYDFVERDPQTRALFSSMSKTEEPKYVLPIGQYLLPLSSARVSTLRRGIPFWQTLAEHGVPVMVQRMPVNYPPEKAGHALSGMGTPDLMGTLGTFTFFTDDPVEIAREVSGGRIVKTQVLNGQALLNIEGPANPLRKDHAPTLAAMTITMTDDVASVQLGDQTVSIKQGEWSNWLSADFVLIPHISKVRGMVRMFAKQLRPGLEIYVSPVNLDPAKPALPISYPARFAAEAENEIGPYSTLGIPEDTSALRQEVLTLSEFREQAELVLQEETKLLDYSLKRFAGGFLFFYFSSVDQNSHVLWGKHEDELLKVYREIDACVGKVRRAQPNAKLIIISDHGFTTFDRAVNLNTWLKQNGFAQQAYAVGLNALYTKLRNPLREKLLAWQDRDNGSKVIDSVTETHPTAANKWVAPDFLVGYAAGYRASWQTGLGETPETLIDDNTDRWIADHCVDPQLVPGVIFSSDKIPPKAMRLQDVTAAVLQQFGIKPPDGYIMAAR